MNKKIRIVIVGMGNIGRAVYDIANKSDKFEVIATYGRHNIHEIYQIEGKADVAIICVGSRSDAFSLTPRLAAMFNTVDSFDTHNKISDYIKAIKKEKSPQSVNIVAAGWDPGLLSIIRVLLRALNPSGAINTLYGAGVSLGHTNAIKTISGVDDAIQITLPVKKENRQKRVCYVTSHPEHRERIESEIKTMPEYFAPYETEVHFVDKIKPMQKHAGNVKTISKDIKAEFKISMKSNIEFTARIMLAYARANYKLAAQKRYGIFTAADIEPSLLLDSVTEFI